MYETSASLLDRLRRTPDAADWNHLAAIYTPFIYGWLRRYDLQHSDAEDLSQEVLGAVIQELPNFHYDRSKGQFRGWLRTIMRHRLLNFWRNQKSRPTSGAGSRFEQMVDQIADPNSEMSSIWNREHDQHVARKLLEIVEREIEPKTWQAFRRTVLDGEDPGQVARDLGLTVNAVYLAKYRVARRLKQEIEGLAEAS